MIKVVTLHEGFSKSNGLTANTEGLRRLVTTRPIEEDIVQGATVPFDGTVESAWFDDVTAANRAFGCSSLLELMASHTLRLVTSENVVIPEQSESRSTSGVKFIAFLQRLPKLSPEAFRQYWRVNHAPLVKPTPRVLRYVQSPCVPAAYEGGRVPFADGVVELWWASIEDFREGWTSDLMQRTQYEDSAKFLTDSLYRYVSVEEVIVE